MEERQNYIVTEFYEYLTQEMNENQIEVWLKANNIIPEYSQLFYDFVMSLYMLVEITYLGDDVVSTIDDKQGHFNWCFNKVIEDFAKEGKRKLLVFSPAFVADCLETVIEIGDEYQEIFEEHGGETIQLVASCNTEDTWIHGLSDFIRQRV